MLKNNYLTFGNSIMQKYCGMTSRINPLALIFLQKEAEEEQPPVRPAQITNVRNYFYRTNHYMYNNVVNRYVQNYNQIVTLLQSNTLYAGSPNFKMDIHPVALDHTVVQTTEDMETVAKQITEHLLKEYVRVDKVQEKATEVIEQNAGRLPKPVIVETAAKLTQELSVRLTKELKTVSASESKQNGHNTETHSAETNNTENRREVTTNLLIRQIEPYIMAMSPGTSHSVIRQEILKVCQKEDTVEVLARELEYFTQSVENQTNTTVIRETIQSLMQKIVEHTDTCRKGKEKYERQIVNRLTPLPVRPISLEFRKEQQETEDGAQGQTAATQENRVLQQKVVQIFKKEQTAESRYYTHFINKFLKKTKEQVITEVDRSTLPAGIIYHQKPKETVCFVNRDVIRLPLEMLSQSQSSSGQEQTVKNQITNQISNEITNQVTNQITSEITDQITNQIINETVNKETVNLVNNDFIRLPLEMLAQPQSSAMQEQVVKDEITRQIKDAVTNEVTSQVTNEITSEISNQFANKTTKEVVHNIEDFVWDYPEHTQRRVIRRTIPDFTASQNAAHRQFRTFYRSVEPAASNQAGALELVLVHEGQGQVPDMEVQDGLAQSGLVQSGLVQSGLPQSIMAQSGRENVAVSFIETAPVALHYKREETVQDEHEEKKSSQSQSSTEVKQPDIEFTREIVTTQNIDHVLTEYIQKQQQIVTAGQAANGMAAGQTAGGMTAGQTQSMMAGQSGAQQSDMVSAAKVERMISESVSRQMDENIQEISRKVYRTLERQIKKEQERRGL